MPKQTRTKLRTVRRGFSLIEMMLVLVILLLTGALVWPALDAAFVHYELRQAAELVRVNLTSARVHAIDDGIVYQFQFAPGSGSFSVAPAEGAAVPLDLASTSDASAGAWMVEEVLPGNGVFAGGSAVSPAGFGAGESNGGTGMEAGHVVYFYPDGMTDDASLILSGGSGASIDVSLRGLTGVVTVSELRTELSEP